MESCDPVGTPMEIKDKLDLDQNGTLVDATKCRSMIDVDYAGCKDTFKSTSDGAQFLGEKLVSWSLKKQDCTALSMRKQNMCLYPLVVPKSFGCKHSLQIMAFTSKRFQSIVIQNQP
nr:hypothetical protein [Tanacetum cinerariifolium]